MPFDSLTFLTVFFPLFLIVYRTASRSVSRNLVLLGFSFSFLFWGSPQFSIVLLLQGLWDYHLGRRIFAADRQRTKKQLLALGILLHLAVLIYFKYLNGIVDQLNAILRLGYFKPIPFTSILLPLGVSFTTFEGISYLVDMMRGESEPPKRPTDYLLFLMMFPHCIAGPIFRWKDLALQIEKRSHSPNKFLSGLILFSFGLGKKVILSAPFGEIADQCFGSSIPQLHSSTAWIGALCFTMQIYFDFSGYSDMAVGIGRISGFDLKRNFNAPYGSDSLSDFWRRWHISLSNWIRDYLYLPLGGRGGGAVRNGLVLLGTFVLSGAWHGASFVFVTWGFYHGTLLLLERANWITYLKRRLPKSLNRGVTFFIVVVGWVIFRSRTMGEAGSYLGAMFGFMPHQSSMYLNLDIWFLPSFYWVVLLAVSILVIENVTEPRVGTKREIRWAFLRYPVAICSLLLSIAYLNHSSFKPFLYFKF